MRTFFLKKKFIRYKKKLFFKYLFYIFKRTYVIYKQSFIYLLLLLLLHDNIF
jgi:hypothetical protein